MSTEFYVTLTWDNFPEGGSFGTSVYADSHDEALTLARWEMACHLSEDDPQYWLDSYGDEWHEIDCFKLHDFIRNNTPPQVRRILDISTGHLTEQTCENVESWSIAYSKGEYGWLVYVPDEINPDLPPDLKTCMAYARSLRCDWIMFDRDAPLVDQLPNYEW